MATSIRSRLLLLTLAWVLPALVAGLWLIDHTAQAERAAGERLLRETSRALALVVDKEISHRATVARLLAQSIALDDSPLLGREQRQRLEEQALAAMVGLDGGVELVADARLVMSIGGAGEPAGPAALASAAALAGGESQPTLDPLRRQNNGQWRAAVVYPVVRAGAVRATLAVTLQASELQRIIDAQAIPDGWIGTIVDNSHQVVARHPGGTAYAGRLVTQDLRERLKAAPEGLFESVSLDGSAVVGYYSTSPQGWTYVTAMPREQFGGPLQGAALRVAIGAAALLGLTMLAGLWVSRGIAISVLTLKRTAQQLQTGALAPQPGTTGIVECDEVALALADAAQGAHNARAELQDQVAQAVARTREAEQRASQGLRLEALGRLTGGMAHDFNNLLGIVSNSAHLIQRAAGSQPGMDMPLAATFRAVEVGARLTQHLTRFAGQQPLRPTALHLDRFLPEFAEMLRSVVGHGVEVEVLVHPQTPPVMVDVGELELALINLALNARDAMPAGGRLRVGARMAHGSEAQGLDEAPYVAIAVMDNGTGIAPDVAARAFEPFFTTKGPGRGTGLGLSQVHGFCRQAGGRVHLATSPGGGATVTLVLPALLSPAASALQAVHTPGEADDAQAMALAFMRVLLVEDDSELGDVTAALLRACGAQVLRAAGAAQALQLLAADSGIEVVLTDVVMPGSMNGLALARVVRERHRLPVVLVSGFAGAASGSDEFLLLPKPTTQAALIKALLEAVAGTRPAGNGAPANAQP